MELKLTNSQRTSTPPIDLKSGPCNNFALSIFSDLRIAFNNTNVVKIQDYHIYSYLKTILTCNDNDMMTWCETRCFANEGRDQDLDTFGTTGFNARRNLFGGVVSSGAHQGKFVFSPMANFFIATIDHPLPSPPLLPCDVSVELQLNNVNRVFQSLNDSAKDINFAFEKVRLIIPQARLSDKLYLSIENRLAKQALRQYFTNTEINTHSIATGSKTGEFDSICSGKNPSRLFVLFQATDRYMGKLDKNVFKYSRLFNEGGTGGSFLLQSVKCYLKGNEVERLNCDETLHSFRDQYFRLFELTQSAGQCCSITFDDFRTRSLIFVFDLTATLSNTSYPMLPLVKDGHLRLTCEFSAPSLIPITMVTVAEIQSSVVIESTGRCTLSSI